MEELALLLLAPTPPRIASSLASQDKEAPQWALMSKVKMSHYLTENLAVLTFLLALPATAAGQSLQKKKKNSNSNSNGLNYLSCMVDRSWSVASFNSLWYRNTKLHHPEVKWRPVTTRFTPVAPEWGAGAHTNCHCQPAASPGFATLHRVVPHVAASPS